MSHDTAFGSRTLAPGDPRHGVVGYREHGCHCWTCQVANRVLENFEKAAARELQVEQRREARRSSPASRSGRQIGFISLERGILAGAQGEPGAERLFLCDDLVYHGPGEAHWHLRQP